MKIVRGLLKIVFSRAVIFTVSILLQIFIIFGIFYFFNEYITYFYLLFVILGFSIIVDILNNESNPMFKLAWVIPILLVPVFGILIYIIFNNQVIPKRVGKILENSKKKTKSYLEQDHKVYEEIYNDDRHVANLVKYMNNYGYYPIYNNTDVKYFSSGEEMYPAFIKELKKAKEFIFMEYFIVAHGRFWYTVLEILKEKVKEGVEVYFMYDGMCSMSLLAHNYPEILASYGIKCKMFNKVVPVLSTHQNNRDHRKITVIDGKVSFTGGINIADEYINEVDRFGYWKDSAIMLKGEATNSFTIMFLSMWNVTEKRSVNYEKYIRNYKVDGATGYVMPYGDSPLDRYEIGKDVYLDLINTSTKYLHIKTPYLILDYELLSALKYASKRGVETIIIMPCIPDKWYTYILARSFYGELLEAGVKIYEYSSGFVHAKEFISDDLEAVVGSINLDYRSLYLHFECAAYMYKCKEIKNIEKDFEETLTKCIEVTKDTNKKYNIFKKVLGRIFRLFAPLM